MRWGVIAIAMLVPAIAHADEQPERRTRFAATADINGGRSWLFGVPIDELGLRMGAGLNFPVGEKNSIEALGGLSLGFGSTEAGRNVGVFAIGLSGVFHLGILRLGLAADVGSLRIATAQSSPDRATYFEARGLVGVEPFELGSFRPYVDLQVRTRAWAETELMTGPALAIGVRY